VLDDFGLAATIRVKSRNCRQTPGRSTYQQTLGIERLLSALETALFRVAQETLRNVGKHTHSTQVRVWLGRHREIIRLEVQDLGQGFEPAGVPPERGAGQHIDLAGMQERITLLGGRFALQSQPEVGIQVVAKVPLPQPIRPGLTRGRPA
jgi:signal transduction histidine kinase